MGGTPGTLRGCEHDDSRRATFPLAARSRHSASTVTPTVIGCVSPTSRSSRSTRAQHLLPTLSPFSVDFIWRLEWLVGLVRQRQ